MLHHRHWIKEKYDETQLSHNLHISSRLDCHINIYFPNMLMTLFTHYDGSMNIYSGKVSKVSKLLYH